MRGSTLYAAVLTKPIASVPASPAAYWRAYWRNASASRSSRRASGSSAAPAPRQRHAARAAIEQRRAELGLERADRARQRRLRDVQRERGAPEVERVADRDEIAQVPELHGIDDTSKVSQEPKDVLDGMASARRHSRRWPARPARPAPSAYGALVLTAALWGSSAVTARGLLDSLPPAWLAALRWVVVLAALAAVRLARPRRDRQGVLARLPRARGVRAGRLRAADLPDLPRPGRLVGDQPRAAQLGDPGADRRGRRACCTTAARARSRLTGLALSLAGVVVIIARGQWSTLASLAFNGHDLVMLLGMGVWAYYTVRLARRDDGLSFPAFMFAAGLLGLAMIVPALGWTPRCTGSRCRAPSAWAGVVYLGVLPTLVAMMLFALRHPPRRAGAGRPVHAPRAGVLGGPRGAVPRRAAARVPRGRLRAGRRRRGPRLPASPSDRLARRAAA